MGGSIGGGSSDSSNESLGSGFNTNSNISGGVNIASGTNQSTNQSSSLASGSSNQGVWDAQSPYLQGGYQAAANLGVQQIPQYQQAYNQAQGINNTVIGAAAPAAAQQYQGGVYGQGGAGQGLMQANQDTMQNGMGQSQWGGPVNAGGQSQWGGQSNFGNVNGYVDAQKQAIAADAGQAQNQMMNNMDARAAGSGMSGGSRHGTAIAQGSNDINRSMLNAQANIGFQANEAAQGRRMQSEEAERNRRMQAGESQLGRQYDSGQQDATRQQAAGESQLGRQMQGAQNLQGMYNTQDATTNMGLGNTNQYAALGNQGFSNLNNQWGGVNNYMGAIGGPQTLTQQQNQSTSDSFGSSSGQTDSLGYNFGIGQGYGENANMGEGSSDSWNFNLAGGM